MRTGIITSFNDINDAAGFILTGPLNPGQTAILKSPRTVSWVGSMIIQFAVRTIFGMKMLYNYNPHWSGFPL